MKIEQCRWQPMSGWDGGIEPKILGDKADIVLVFTSKDILHEHPIMAKLKEYYPKAEIIGCASYGEIARQEITEEALVLTAIHFEHSVVKVISRQVDDISQSEELGHLTMKELPKEGLRHVFVLSDGVKVAGSALVKGISSLLPTGVGLTGGFAGKTTFHNKILPDGNLIAIGFYGDNLEFGYASRTGWKSYGVIRKITKSIGETLYELDGKPVLDLYKEFLGPFAAELPEIGLLYPISIWEDTDHPENALARTIIGINDEEKSMHFAGDVPVGYNAQFMLTNNDMLVKGASSASEETLMALNNNKPELALLVTCVSRKMVMKQRIEEELDAVSDVLGKTVVYAGIYSWGEITPIRFEEKSYFQNQVMAITGISETKP